jgi:hypothetical protein
MAEKWQRYLFSYRFDGDEYSFDIPARNAAEAKQRLSAMGMARYDGEIMATIKVPGGNWLSRLLGWT